MISDPMVLVRIQEGFAQYVFASHLNLFVDGAGTVKVSSPICNVREMLMSPSECRDALFEERDLWT